MSLQVKDKESAISGSDFSTLETGDDYSAYFKQLTFAFDVLKRRYEGSGDASPYESEVVSLFTGKLLETIAALRLKYSFQKADARPLWIDTSESGFPNQNEVAALEVDLRTRVERLHEVPSSKVLRRNIVDYLFLQQKDPVHLLEQLAERAFLEKLSGSQMFMPFTAGELRFLKQAEGCRTLAYPFGCYDFKTNRPYIHVLYLEQPATEPSLTTDVRRWTKFMEIVEAEGRRAPLAGVLAMALDQAFDQLRLKQLKRICIGPCYSRLLLDRRPGCETDPREPTIRALFKRFPGGALDFVLFVTHETVFSRRQEMVRSLLNPAGSRREVYQIDESDPRCAELKASHVQDIVILPHRMLQHLKPEDQNSIAGFAAAVKITFDERGVAHGI